MLKCIKAAVLISLICNSFASAGLLLSDRSVQSPPSVNGLLLSD